MMQRTRGLWCLLALLLLGGCGLPFTLVHVRPAASTNQRRPLYMLVRNMDRKAYLQESYEEVTALVLNPDKTVLRLQVLHPGHPVSLLVGKPSRAPLALYFLFTDPADGWRLFLEAPVSLLVRVDLENNRLKP